MQKIYVKVQQSCRWRKGGLQSMERRQRMKMLRGFTRKYKSLESIIFHQKYCYRHLNFHCTNALQGHACIIYGLYGHWQFTGMAFVLWIIFVIINKILFPVLDGDPRPASHQLEADPRHSPGDDLWRLLWPWWQRYGQLFHAFRSATVIKSFSDDGKAPRWLWSENWLKHRLHQWDHGKAEVVILFPQ